MSSASYKTPGMYIHRNILNLFKNYVKSKALTDSAFTSVSSPESRLLFLSHNIFLFKKVVFSKLIVLVLM
jgi:hypothetical protein